MISLFDVLLQAYIALTACAAIWLLSRNDAWHRWGFVAGLIGQPAWLWSTFGNGQIGISLVSLFFAWVYAYGFWTEFVRPPRVALTRKGGDR